MRCATVVSANQSDRTAIKRHVGNAKLARQVSMMPVTPLRHQRAVNGGAFLQLHVQHASQRRVQTQHCHSGRDTVKTDKDENESPTMEQWEARFAHRVMPPSDNENRILSPHAPSVRNIRVNATVKPANGRTRAKRVSPVARLAASLEHQSVRHCHY